MLSLLTQKTQNQRIDTLGNVKIPALDTLHVSLEDIDWQAVDDSQEVQYSSLLGVPVTNIPDQGNATFDITSRYWDVVCTENTWFANYTELPGGLNRTEIGWKKTASYFKMTQEAPSLEGKIPIHFMTGDPYNWPVHFANCTLERLVVDSSISCTSGTCHVTATRPGNQSAGSSNTGWVPLYNTLSFLPDVFLKGGYGSLKTVSALELWLMDPTSDLTEQILDDNIFRNISELPTEVLASRLRIAINSFWQSSYAARYIEGYIPANVDNFTTRYEYLPPYSFNSSEARVVLQAGENYVCQWVWAVLLFGTSVLLFLAACSTAILQSIILAPDILGYVSSSARDNPHVISSSHGSFLGGLEWAYRFRDIKVMVGNVCAEGEEGRIGMASKLEGQPQRLSKGTVYM